MRNAIDRSNIDFDDYEDDAGHAPRSKLRFLPGLRSIKYLGVMAATVLGGAIVMNALFFQEQRHAAPLFQTSLLPPPVQSPTPSVSAQATPSAPAATSAPAPAPAPRPVDIVQATQSIRPAQRVEALHIETPQNDPIAREIIKIDPVIRRDAPKLTRPKVVKTPPVKGPETKISETKAIDRKVAVAKPVETTARPVKQNDAIAGLLRNNAAAPSSSASILSAQRSLQKLGYVVRADGVNNDATRQAVQSFAKDNSLPGKGELNAQVMQALTKMSAN